ncbi:peptidylprolyl isomerase [Chitiniphilus purpureus]|uniref:Peptidylprolyl isomerase n=1 Tax=Chitiniphilus purpureus TaxID=2981137 RepID=A0ABY6DI94_9NEIS|nr:peptidylprolyl isomerase [Chitiniphilus sp. CD1]UXY14070.1 peptidylprolyl isomerase [Chitiniphilus sp. CD1]
MGKKVWWGIAAIAVGAWGWWSLGQEPERAMNVVCETTKGRMQIVVRPDWSPRGAARFLQLVDEGAFTGMPLFRCVDNFLCQFGYALPQAKLRAYPPIEDDPARPDLRPFKRGFVSFAGNGAHSRSQHLFITLGESVQALGSMPWETPIGYVTAPSMAKTVSRFTTEYGDIPPWGAGPDPQRIPAPDGADYLRRDFPRLDYIQRCARG